MPIEIGIALIAMYGATLTAYVATAAFFGWRLGRVPTRQEYAELRNELKADNTQLREELKADMAQLRQEQREDMAQLRQEQREDMAQLRQEQREDMAELREDMAQLRQELLAEFRRSHQQLMLALVNHSHNEEGQAVFTAPPDLETTPTPADN